MPGPNDKIIDPFASRPAASSTYVRPSMVTPAFQAKVVQEKVKEETKGMTADQRKAYDLFQERKKTTPAPKAGLANAVRTISPLGKNATGVLLKKTIGNNAMNTKTLSGKEKSIMYRVVENAIKRTGKLSGGTEYEDFKGTTSDANYQRIMDAKNGKVEILKGAALGAVDEAYDLATSTGRGSYVKNPATGEILYTDGYDFVNNFTQDKKTGKLKENYMAGNSTAYGRIRRKLAEEDQGGRNSQSYAINFLLSPKDTVSARPASGRTLAQILALAKP